jgi:hypothetical protein
LNPANRVRWLSSSSAFNISSFAAPQRNWSRETLSSNRSTAIDAFRIGIRIASIKRYVLVSGTSHPIADGSKILNPFLQLRGTIPQYSQQMPSPAAYSVNSGSVQSIPKRLYGPGDGPSSMYSYADRDISPSIPLNQSQERVSYDAELVKNSSHKIAAPTRKNGSRTTPVDQEFSKRGQNKTGQRHSSQKISSKIVGALHPRRINGERIWQCPAPRCRIQYKRPDQLVYHHDIIHRQPSTFYHCSESTCFGSHSDFYTIRGLIEHFENKLNLAEYLTEFREKVVVDEEPTSPKDDLKLSLCDETSTPTNKSKWVSEFSQQALRDSLGVWCCCHCNTKYLCDYQVCLKADCGRVKCANCTVE